jgi:hypothetical protein
MSWTMIVHKTQNSEPRSAYQMVKLLLLEWRYLPPISASNPFSQPESAYDSKTMRAARKMSKGHL